MPGMGLADARVLRPDLDLGEADFSADRAALLALARWCNRFSPWTTPDGDDGIALDISGCAHLFGGERALAMAMIERLARRGITGRVAIADHLGAAWAVAHGGPEICAIVPPGAARVALADLPVTALRLDLSAAELLVQLGLRRIGDLYALPRAALVARCGARMVQRLDQALGLMSEPLSPLVPASAYWSHRSFVEPLVRPEDLAAASRVLIADLCRDLAVAGQGARQLILAFYRVDGRVEEERIGTAMPTRDPYHLWRLFEERLPLLDPGLGVEDMALFATRVEPLASSQHRFGGTIALAESGAGLAAAEADLAALVDHLSQRLGVAAVARLQSHQSHVPERAVRFLSAFHHAAVKAPWQPGRLRPIRLLPRPEPIEAIAPVPDDPPLQFRWRRRVHRLRSADGPERLSGEWWRESAPLRDYYRVEDEEGRRFWLYRAGLYRPETRPQWFLHGFFA